MSTALSDLKYEKSGRPKRVSSYAKDGSNADSIRLPKGEEITIFDINGPCEIRHIWCTLNSYGISACYRKIVLRMYWDNEDTPSVEAPLGDFFGVGFGVANHYTSLPLNMITIQGAPQEFSAMNCFFPMPFLKHGKITVTNESEVDISAFYFYVDYVEAPTFKEVPMYFHAVWRREFPTDGTMDMVGIRKADPSPDAGAKVLNKMLNPSADGNYVILDAVGNGHYVGCNLSTDNINPVPGFNWFGEGDDMIFIDDEPWPPSLHGTGTEDYFCCAWNYPSGEFSSLYHGVSFAHPIPKDLNEKSKALPPYTLDYSGKWTTYRFHIEDPIMFKKSIRVTVEHGHANCHSNDLSSTAYWYQSEPHKPQPPILPVEERIPLSDEESLDRFCESI